MGRFGTGFAGFVNRPFRLRGVSFDGKHLRCREFRLNREGWWGVWGEEGAKKVGFRGYGRFGTVFVGFVNRPFRSRGVSFLANLDPIFWPEGCFAS